MRTLLLLAVAVPLAAADVAPSWLKDAAAMTVPGYPPKVNRVVLLREEHLAVAPDGKRVMRERGAIRFIQRDRETARAYRVYNTKSGRVRDFQAWLLSPDGSVQLLSSKGRVADFTSSENAFSESSMKMLDCPKDLPAGSIFGWEIVEEEKTIFTQATFSFQGTDPVLLSRFLLTTPPGWEARGTVMNGPDVPSKPWDGGGWMWEMRNLPWIADEQDRPAPYTFLPRLGVSYYPTSSAPPELKPLPTWSAVSGWLTPLVDPQAEVTPQIQAKAAELVAGADSLTAKLTKLAAFVQQTTYVSVQMNLTRAGGYKPHRAQEVLTRNYGDCKDKATLMRALLKALDIDSWMVVLHSGDRDYVRPQWPSTLQFNHAILAIRVPADLRMFATVDHLKLGRLLFFDPTDAHTRIGDLPGHEQGSDVLVLAGAEGELVRLPLGGPERNHVESIVTGVLTPLAALEAKLERTYSGEAASYMRYRQLSDSELRKLFESSLAHRVGGLTVTSAALKTGDADPLKATVEFQAKQFGQIAGGRLMTITPGALMPNNDYVLAEKTRTLPLKLTARSRRNVVRLTTPDGFEADEIPEPVKVSGPYGEYEARWKVELGEIVFDQTVRYRDVTIPAQDYGKAQAFFDQFAGSQTSPVVLIRKR